VTVGRALGIVGGLIALAGSVLLLLVAVDARAWSDAIRDDDTVFRVTPKEAAWAPEERAPFGLTRRVLALDDDLALRRAIQRFQLARFQSAFFNQSTSLQASRARAQIALAAVERDAPRVRDKSIAANLLGVLAFQEARGDPIHAQQAIQRAAQAFRRAILADGSNEDAKANLELIVRLQQANNALKRQQNGVFGNARGRGTGAGSGGSGY
jgi:hypothetical protein